MENLLANTDKLKGAMKDKIEANKDKGILSKKLATILLDCPVTFNESDYELIQPNLEKTDALFQELEFRQMKTQFDKLYNPVAIEDNSLSVTTTATSKIKNGAQDDEQ